MGYQSFYIYTVVHPFIVSSPEKMSTAGTTTLATTTLHSSIYTRIKLSSHALNLFDDTFLLLCILVVGLATFIVSQIIVRLLGVVCTLYDLISEPFCDTSWKTWALQATVARAIRLLGQQFMFLHILSFSMKIMIFLKPCKSSFMLRFCNSVPYVWSSLEPVIN